MKDPTPTPDQNPDAAVECLAQLLDAGRRIVFLTGAGISTESGIPDFRSANGLYLTGTSESVFDIGVFVEHPEVFYEFARRFLPILRSARPNAGHRAIARLARARPETVTVVTQNIDLLHQEAGSPVVLPVHGTVATSTCIMCGHRTSTEDLVGEILEGTVPRHPGCGGVYKPDIVFFGEALPVDVFEKAVSAIREADVLVVVGSSLAVQPAGGLPSLCRPECRTAVINLTGTWLDLGADCVIRAQAGPVLEEAVSRVLDAGES